MISRWKYFPSGGAVGVKAAGIYLKTIGKEPLLGVQIRPSRGVMDLIEENGRVIGVIAEHKGKRLRIRGAMAC